MYRVNYDSTRSAIRILYRFMTMSFLTRPECTAWGENGPLFTLTNDRNDFMDEKDFSRKVLGNRCVAVTCTASTDKADRRRVVLTFMENLEFIVLNFPSANGKLNDAERKVKSLLECA